MDEVKHYRKVMVILIFLNLTSYTPFWYIKYQGPRQRLRQAIFMKLKDLWCSVDREGDAGRTEA